MDLSPQQSADWIASRHSVYPKFFEPHSNVSNKEIHQLLQVAKWAPTHKLTQPWRFHVFNTPPAKATFLNFFEKVSRQLVDDNTRHQMQMDKMTTKVDLSCAIIGIVLQRDVEKRVPEWEEMCSVACAVQNIALHAKSMGLGGYWSTGAYTNHPLSKEFLKIKELDRHMGWFFLGRTHGESEKKRSRKEVEEYVVFE